MTPPARRPGGRSAAVLSAVRAATTRLLDEVGYDALTLPDVAALAGVNKTTVYRRWPTKADLVGDLLQDLATRDVPVDDTGGLEGDLVALMEGIAGLARTRAITEILRAALASADPEVRDARRRFWLERFDRASVVVERAVARGELPEGTDPRSFLEHACAPVWFRLLVTGDPVGPEDVATFAARAARPFTWADTPHASPGADGGVLS